MNTWERIQMMFESLLTEAENIVKKTNYPKSFTLSHDEYKQWLDLAQKGEITADIVSAIDGKHITTLNSSDIVTSLLKMKPTLQVVTGEDGKKGQYWVCNIPMSALGRSKQAKRAIPKEGAFGGGGAEDGDSGDQENG